MPVSAVPEPAAGSVNPVAILPAASRSATGEGGAVTVQGAFSWLVFEVVVSAVAGAVVDLWIQQSWDGVNWDDLVSIGALGAVTVYSAAVPVRKRDADAELHAWQEKGLGAGTVRSTVVGRRFRAVWTFTAPGTMTFQVLAHLR